MIAEIIKFVIYSVLIVIISKYILVRLLRLIAEKLNLKSKTVGQIAGVATSVPELLTITFSAVTGFIETSIYNVLSSNIINVAQYSIAIVINKNVKHLSNKALKIDLVLVLLTILIPIMLLITNIQIDVKILPILIILFIMCVIINNNTHKLYLENEGTMENEIISENKGRKDSSILKYILYLIITSIVLFVVGNLLGESLERLCKIFNVKESVMGILLGIITSLPELITFFESQKHHKNNNNEKLGVVEATNNLVTSNVLNLFVIQSLGIIVYTIFS